MLCLFFKVFQLPLVVPPFLCLCRLCLVVPLLFSPFGSCHTLAVDSLFQMWLCKKSAAPCALFSSVAFLFPSIHSSDGIGWKIFFRLRMPSHTSFGSLSFFHLFQSCFFSILSYGFLKFLWHCFNTFCWLTVSDRVFQFSKIANVLSDRLYLRFCFNSCGNVFLAVFLKVSIKVSPSAPLSMYDSIQQGFSDIVLLNVSLYLSVSCSDGLMGVFFFFCRSDYRFEL